MDSVPGRMIFGGQPSGLVQRYAPSARLGAAVDVGCGIGGTARWLAEQGFDAVGIDRTDHRAAWVASERLSYRCVDVRDFAFDALAPTLVNARHVLQFLGEAEQRTTLDRMIGSLRPEGLLVVESFTTDEPGRPGSGRHFAPGELGEWLASAGLTLLLYREETVLDDHPPVGRHRHGIVQAVGRKLRSRR